MWILVGQQTAIATWQTVGVAVSDLIRVSYTMPAPTRPPLGVLRQRWELDGQILLEGVWTKIYPKLGTYEIYRIPIPPEFSDAGIFERDLQARNYSNWPWTVTIEQWL